ncbi:MAG: polysaccharide deacetylase family protein [Acidobacteriota bacterium]
MKLIMQVPLSIALILLLIVFSTCRNQPEQDQRSGAVVLTFDDAVKSHRTVVAPLLRKLGFGATFFVTHRWMTDSEYFLTWEEVSEIHQMGFEIGNHSWTHADFSTPRNAARLPAELALVESRLEEAGVPKPVSFAYSGNAFGPETVEQLRDLGYRFARRGMQPEVPYGAVQPGPVFDPEKNHRLLIPTTGDAYPEWTLEHFQRVVQPAREGRIVVLQFHGVPDPVHPWVHTPPDRFRDYMAHLKEHDFRVIALRDLAPFLPDRDPDDALLDARYPDHPQEELQLPAEMEATRADLGYWLENMLRYHRYDWSEVQSVTGLGLQELKEKAEQTGLRAGASVRDPDRLRVLPYPGGRHPRIGFLEGAVHPHRGTKASVFLPWDASSYVVVDLPEAIFSNRGLIYLAHTHIPTVWDEQNQWIENVDWRRHPDGSLRSGRELPNGIAFGASLRPRRRHVEMELWLRNGSDGSLSGLRTQICVMLKGASDFSRQSNENKRFESPVAAVRSATEDRWILTAWDRCGRAWGNAEVPCFHADPMLPDCPPGQTVRVRGRLWFYEGQALEEELQKARQRFSQLP